MITQNTTGRKKIFDGQRVIRFCSHGCVTSVFSKACPDTSTPPPNKTRREEEEMQQRFMSLPKGGDLYKQAKHDVDQYWLHHPDNSEEVIAESAHKQWNKDLLETLDKLDKLKFSEEYWELRKETDAKFAKDPIAHSTFAYHVMERRIASAPKGPCQCDYSMGETHVHDGTCRGCLVKVAKNPGNFWDSDDWHCEHPVLWRDILVPWDEEDACFLKALFENDMHCQYVKTPECTQEVCAGGNNGDCGCKHAFRTTFDYKTTLN
jgi:hypothetical protein